MIKKIIIGFKNIVLYIVRFIRTWSELLTLPLSIIVWYLMPYWLRRIDPTAGSHDIGLIQTFLIAFIGLFFGTAVIWLLLKFSMPELYRILDGFLHDRNKELTRWQKGVFALSFFAIYLFAYVALVSAFV